MVPLVSGFTHPSADDTTRCKRGIICVELIASHRNVTRPDRARNEAHTGPKRLYVHDLMYNRIVRVRPRRRELREGYSPQFKSKYFTEICSAFEAGSYLRLIDFGTTQLKA